MKITLIFFGMLLLLQSCSKDNDTSTFKGNWKGKYSGASDAGTFKFSIDANSMASGSVTSTVFVQTFAGTGIVTNNGQLTLTFGTVTSGATFEGLLSGANATGTWVNNSSVVSYTGTWSGTKE